MLFWLRPLIQDTLSVCVCIAQNTVNYTIAADTIGHVDQKWYLMSLSKQPLLLLLLYILIIFLVKGLNNASNCVTCSGVY